MGERPGRSREDSQPAFARWHGASGECGCSDSPLSNQSHGLTMPSGLDHVVPLGQSEPSFLPTELHSPSLGPWRKRGHPSALMPWQRLGRSIQVASRTLPEPIGAHRRRRKLQTNRSSPSLASAAAGHGRAGPVQLASLSAPTGGGLGSVGPVDSVGREEQRAAAGGVSWPTYVILLGAQARTLMAQVPLLERACIGAIAGGLAGGFTNVTLHPIDTVKTKLQTKGAASVYRGPLDVVQKVLAKDGLAGFYRGLPAVLVGSTISSSVYFGMYELGKGALGAVARFPSAAVPPLAAAVGNVASSAILVPKEVLKQRMQAGAVGTTLQVLAGTLKAEGIGGLYSGYSAALLRNLPSNMLSFSTFEYLKAAWLANTGKETLEPWQSLLSGAGAGALSAALTTPLDVVKTRLMTQARQAVAASGAPAAQIEAAARARAIAAYTYTGVAATLQKIWREEGAKGLMTGMGPRVLYSACFSAVGFLSFETGRVFLIRRHLEGLERRQAKVEERSRESDGNQKAFKP